MLALVAVLAFVLLMIAFRSLAISLVSILLNLLSVGAAYGLITLVFQDGRLQGLLGYRSFGGIISWVPLFMLVFLFGIQHGLPRVHPQPHPRAVVPRRGA